ncbi:hypothetical protein BABINDRAFT_167044 [Babjeviella inositovora NRRL Y-12698]|uniref:RRM domain-containing protein n=1 Tax=Babjeviella inositovora NRRL Y-12698 TaxID=984486 RepID=A0A1E3QQI2_9ASCO|nr:uncharacterized protein BABINDRAFT_167044 [Babjeviella inositovora NRRL Y-12698]ODQ79939.1 hypothetical protein BABINDRAFT_167044 [Babjeviella inositovora NRRL Y-12698]
MNKIKSIQKLNQQELDANISASASWHADYKDTSYIYIGQLPYELTEGDLLTVFSQYGVPSNIKLVRDPESGKSMGFGYLKYEDYRSCVLAVDNLNGIDISGRKILVDHGYYKLREGERESDFAVEYSEEEKGEGSRKRIRSNRHNDRSNHREKHRDRDGHREYRDRDGHKGSRSDDKERGHESSRRSRDRDHRSPDGKDEEDPADEDPMKAYLTKGLRSHSHRSSDRHKSRDSVKENNREGEAEQKRLNQ